MRILVVEDDEKLSKILAVALSGLGDVDIALSGEKALQDVEKTYYDLIILDLMLGKLSGMEVLREIRRVHLMPIIILSALSDIDKKIDCFREGADDYITKPFAREELIVRCEAALRRVGGNFRSTIYTFGKMEVNYTQKMVTWGGNYVPMNRKTYEILELLVRNKEVIMTKQQIFDRIYLGLLFSDGHAGHRDKRVQTAQNTFGVRAGQAPQNGQIDRLYVDGKGLTASREDVKR